MGNGASWYGATRSSQSLPELRVGVLTLNLGDEVHFLPGQPCDQFNTLVTQGSFNLQQAGQPYSASPDDWVPFGDGTSILAHLRAGLDGFDVFADSLQLSEFRTRRGIRLFVIDLAVLLHPGKANLASLIQEHVCSRNDCAACIIVPRGIPNPFRETLLGLSSDKLSDLDDNSDATLVEVEIDRPEELRRFLRRITPYLGGHPVPARAAELVAVLQGMGVPLVGAIAAPIIGAGVKA
jgi:hypothetical protein